MRNQPRQAQQATPPNPQPNPDSDSNRTARHLQTCRDLTDAAVTLAKAAAQTALQSLAEPATTTTQSPDPAQTTLFARLTAIALRCMALETRIAKDAARRPAQPTFRTPDPRRPVLTRALHQAAGPQPNAAALREAMDTQLDRELAADPRATTPNATIIRRICNGFGVPIDDEPHPSFPRYELYAALDSG